MRKLKSGVLQISKIFAYECVKNEAGVLKMLILIMYLASIWMCICMR